LYEKWIVFLICEISAIALTFIGNSTGPAAEKNAVPMLITRKIKLFRNTLLSLSIFITLKD